jgi:hypothetical protein
MNQPMDCYSWYGIGDGSIGMCTLTGGRCIGKGTCSDYRSRLPSAIDAVSVHDMGVAGTYVLEAELVKVQAERDALALEVAELRAFAAQSEDAAELAAVKAEVVPLLNRIVAGCPGCWQADRTCFGKNGCVRSTNQWEAAAAWAKRLRGG